MLDNAIEQERRGYSSEPDEQVTQLHRYYWGIAQNDFPLLGMEKPAGVPAGNLWIGLKPSLPGGMKLRRKMGNVDLELRGKSGQEEAFRKI